MLHDISQRFFGEYHTHRGKFFAQMLTYRHLKNDTLSLVHLYNAKIFCNVLAFSYFLLTIVTVKDFWESIWFHYSRRIYRVALAILEAFYFI